MCGQFFPVSRSWSAPVPTARAPEWKGGGGSRFRFRFEGSSSRPSRGRATRGGWNSPHPITNGPPWTVLSRFEKGEREMKSGKWILAGLALAFALGNAQAGIDLNEVGAFLVFPGAVAALNTPGNVNVETFLTIT